MRDAHMSHQMNPTPERQDDALSTNGQLKALREHAENNGYVVVREYVDDPPADALVKRMNDEGRTAARG